MTTFADNFDRANVDPIGSPNWVTVTGEGDLQITGQHVSPSNLATDSAARLFGFTFGADQEASAVLNVTGTAGGGSGAGVAVRCAGAARTFYRFIADHATNNNCQLSRKDAGVSTDLATFTQAWTDGSRWRLRVIGTGANTVLTIWLNDVLIRTVTDPASAISSGAPGIAYSSTETAAVIEDFIATDVLADRYFLYWNRSKARRGRRFTTLVK